MHDVLFKILKKYVSLQHLYFVTPCDYIINGNQYIRVYLPPPYTAPQEFRPCLSSFQSKYFSLVDM